jgi:hypothetical protein
MEFAVKNNESDPKYWFNYAITAMNAGKPEVAYPAILKCKELNPNYPNIEFVANDIRNRLGK